MNSKITVLLSCLSFSCQFICAQYEWVTPAPSGAYGLKVIFTDSTHGYIFSGNGDLLETNDQGANWTVKQNFPSTYVMDLKDSTGIISGSFAAYITQDAGKTWQKKPNNIASSSFRMADVVNRDTIFVAAENGQIYRTDDAGTTWKNFTCGIPISSIDFVDSKIGYAGGRYSQILKTEDGGITWKAVLSVNITPSNTMVMKFLDRDTGFAFREFETMLRTTDGGKTWQSTSVNQNIHSLQFINKTTGFACGAYGVAYRTDDAGKTWTYIGGNALIAYNDLYSIFFLDAKTGFTVGARGRILKTSDGGSTWNSYSPTYLTVTAISVPSRDTFYATYANTIYKTTNRGKKWQQLPLTVGTGFAEYDLFQSCHFFSSDTGIVTASDNARVYKTYDGGANWKSIKIHEYSYDDVLNLQFLDKATGFALISSGYTSAIMKTKDAGESWKEVWHPQYSNENFNYMYFVDEKTGFAARYDVLFMTEDSARTWVQLWQKEDIRSIWFPSPSTGFAAGDAGMLRRTDDGGKTWTDVQLPPNLYAYLEKIKFINEQVGYLTTEYGVVYKTIDGGKTWKSPYTWPSYPIKAIEFSPDSSVYFGGEYGSIIRAKVADRSIDSLSVTLNQDCTAEFSAVVTAAYSKTDSIKFIYESGGEVYEVWAIPSSLSSQRQKVSAITPPLPALKAYRVKIITYYDGIYHDGPNVIFYTGSVPAPPVIATPNGTNFCAGDSVTLQSSMPDQNQWLLNGVPIAGATNQVYIARQAGLYQLLRIRNCYVSDTASVNITMQAAIVPVVNISYTGCHSDSLSFHATVVSAGFNPLYFWFVNDSLAGNESEFRTNTIPNGTMVRCRITSSEDCSRPQSVEDSIIVNCQVTAVSDIDGLQEFLLFPNPTTGVLNISMKLNTPKKLAFTVTSLLGRLVLEKQVGPVAGSLTSRLDLSSLPRGVYVLKTTLDNNSIIRKILKLD